MIMSVDTLPSPAPGPYLHLHLPSPIVPSPTAASGGIFQGLDGSAHGPSGLAESFAGTVSSGGTLNRGMIVTDSIDTDGFSFRGMLGEDEVDVMGESIIRSGGDGPGGQRMMPWHADECADHGGLAFGGLDTTYTATLSVSERSSSSHPELTLLPVGGLSVGGDVLLGDDGEEAEAEAVVAGRLPLIIRSSGKRLLR